MHTRRAFTLAETAVVAAIGLVGAAIAQVGLGPAEIRKPTTSLLKLRHLGQATAQYQADNNNYTPITLTYTRGIAPRSPYISPQGWCAWSAGGKNNDRWWPQSSTSPGFDVEAADRPLNEYAEPGVVYYAPAFPGRLSALDPARTTAQAESFKDPFDTWTTQRAWPTPTTSISTYNDVGTSYLWNSTWFEQIGSAYPTLSFENKLHEGTRRIAQGDGANPSRFVWMSDPAVSVVIHQPTTAQITNWYGATNRSVMLFLDGRAAYLRTYPGRRGQSFVNPDYSLVFENLPYPGSG